jgi:hypothetical protein
MSNATAETSLTREELYNRVWATPMRKLAMEFGLSDVGLAKICKKHKIPRPSRGYWAKVENGKAAKRWPLRPVDDASLALVRVRHVVKRVETPQIMIAHDPEIATLITAESLPENHIEVASDLRGADPLVAATRESLAKQEPDEYGRISRRYDFPNSSFEVAVSKANVHRALLLLHTLIRALKSRGYVLTGGTDAKKAPRITVLGRAFSISVWEPSKRTPRELTKAEKEERARWSWSSVRDYQYVPTGSLELHLDRDTYWSKAKLGDTKKQPLENRLNEFVVAMLRVVDKERVEAEKARLAAIEKEKRRQKAVELEMMRRAECVREERLRRAVPVWENARRIKEYITAVRAEASQRAGEIDDASEIGQWLRWAEQYFDAVNPLSDRVELPTFSLTPSELEQLKRECEEDWQSYSETFRPRQPR